MLPITLSAVVQSVYYDALIASYGNWQVNLFTTTSIVFLIIFIYFVAKHWEYIYRIRAFSRRKVFFD